MCGRRDVSQASSGGAAFTAIVARELSSKTQPASSTAQLACRVASWCTPSPLVRVVELSAPRVLGRVGSKRG